MIDDFEAKTTSSVFTQITKSEFVSSLRGMVENPNTISQSGTNTCGAAAACKVMADYDPESFVQMALDIFQTGKSKSDRFEGTDIVANNTDKAPVQGLNAAAFVLLPNIVNSYNSILTYDAETNGEWNGATTPGQISGFIIDHSNVSNTSPLIRIHSDNDIDYIWYPVLEGHGVIALVDSSGELFMGTGTDSWSKVFGNHYVIITGITSVEGDNQINVSFWTWGEKTNRNVTLSKSDFNSAIKTFITFN